MSGGTYVIGVAVLVAIVGPLWLAARRLRAHLVPEWSRQLAWVADAVIAVALLEACAQLVGTVGEFRRGPLVAVALGISLVVVAALTVRRGGARNPARSSGLGSAEGNRMRFGAQLAIVLALIVIVSIPWLAQTVGSLRTGVLGYDSLNYHLPFAARFFQTGRVTSLYFTFPDLNTAFDPANAELLHAVGMVALRSDVLSAIQNLGWLSLALLAAWCAHPNRSVRLASLLGVGVLLSSPFFVAFDGGRATNDLAGIALFLSGIALILNGGGRRAPTALAAVASGLALATKLTMVVPVVALTAGVIASARKGNRLRVTRVWVAWLVVTGSYWYVRNIVLTGGPVPAHLGVGPVAFPSPRPEQPYRSYSVAHYIADLHIWRSWFLPGLHDCFGWAWPVIIGLAAAGWVIALVRGDRVLRMLGMVGIVSFLGYLVTPLGAGGPEGRPILFSNDIRFSFPALALGLLLLPRVLPPSHIVRRRWLPALLGIAVVNDLAYSLKLRVSLLLVALLLELAAVVIVGVVAVVRPRRSRRLRAALVCVLVLVAAPVGWAVERSYLTHRYANVARDVPYASAPRTELVAVYAWVRHVSNARIALVGLGISYPLFGSDLSNEVQYVGHTGPHGEFGSVTTCPEWRQRLNAGRFDFVVISGNSNKAREPVEARWTRSDPAATLVVRAGTASVYRVTGDFDPNGCRKRS